MKYLVLGVLLGQISFANSAEDDQLRNACSGQIMSAVVSASKDPTGTFKKTIFSKKVDKEFLASFEELSSVMKKIQASKAAPDKDAIAKIQATYKKISMLAEKEAKPAMNVCMDWMSLLNVEGKKICTGVSEKDTDFQSKINACAEKAGKLPAVNEKFTKWMDAFKAMSLANPSTKK